MSGHSSTGAMYCAHCGRPASTLVWINGVGYHPECTHGPGYQQPTYGPNLFPIHGGAFVPATRWISEEDVRRIVREELVRAGLKDGGAVAA